MSDLIVFANSENFLIAAEVIAILAIAFWAVRRFIFVRKKSIVLKPFDIGNQPSDLRDLMEEFNKRLDVLVVNEQRSRTRLKERLDYDLESMSPTMVLNTATVEEKGDLAALMSLTGFDSEEAITSIRKAGSHAAATAIRALGSGEKYVEYIAVVRDVAAKVGVKVIKRMTVYELEKQSVLTIFDKMANNLTPEQQASLVKEIRQKQGESYAGVAAGASVLALVKVSGLGFYLASASSMAGIASAVGFSSLSLSAASVLSVATGPAGWAALTAILIFKVGGPDFKRTVPAVLMVATVRARQIATRDEEIFRLRAFLAGELTNERAELYALFTRIDTLRSASP